MEPTLKYIDEQNRIAKAAFCLFRDNGFDNTSISDIAKKAGIQKGLVQYYFPKKENFINMFIEQSIAYISESLDTSEIKTKNKFDHFYLIGYFETWYLFKHKSTDKLRLDILSSRNYSRTILKCINEYVIENLAIPMTNDYKEKLECGFAFAIGGVFEYAYDELLNNEDFKIDEIVDSIIGFFSSYMQLPKPVKVKKKLDDEWLLKKSLEVDKIMFG